MKLPNYTNDELLVKRQEARAVLLGEASLLRPQHILSLRDGLFLIERALDERGVSYR